MSLGSYLNKQQVAFIIHLKQTNKYSNINKRYGREVTAKNINKPAVTIPEEVFLQQKPTGLQASSSNSQNLTWTPLHSSLKKKTPEPPFNLSSCFLNLPSSCLPQQATEISPLSSLQPQLLCSLRPSPQALWVA